MLRGRRPDQACTPDNGLRYSDNGQTALPCPPAAPTVSLRSRSAFITSRRALLCSASVSSISSLWCRGCRHLCQNPVHASSSFWCVKVILKPSSENREHLPAPLRHRRRQQAPNLQRHAISALRSAASTASAGTAASTLHAPGALS